MSGKHAFVVKVTRAPQELRLARALRHILSPAPPHWLPLRYWRRLWLAAAVRLLVALPLVAVLAVPYWLARGLVAALDWTGGQFDRLYVWASNADREHSGWTPPSPPRRTIKLSPEWVRGDDR